MIRGPDCRATSVRYVLPRHKAADWGELVQVHDECDVTQASPVELPDIVIHSL